MLINILINLINFFNLIFKINYIIVKSEPKINLNKLVNWFRESDKGWLNL